MPDVFFSSCGYLALSRYAIRQSQFSVEQIKRCQRDECVHHANHAILEQLNARVAQLFLVKFHQVVSKIWCKNTNKKLFA